MLWVIARPLPYWQQDSLLLICPGNCIFPWKRTADRNLIMPYFEMAGWGRVSLNVRKHCFFSNIWGGDDPKTIQKESFHGSWIIKFWTKKLWKLLTWQAPVLCGWNFPRLCIIISPLISQKVGMQLKGRKRV